MSPVRPLFLFLAFLVMIIMLAGILAMAFLPDNTHETYLTLVR